MALSRNRQRIGRGPLRLLCISSSILGNRTYAEVFADALRADPAVVLRTITLGPEDLGTTRGLLAKVSDVFQAEDMVRAALSREDPQGYDALVVLCWEFLTALPAEWHDLPAATILDVTPALTRTVGSSTSGNGKQWARPLLRAIHSRRFGRAAARGAAFLPMSEWAARSLVDDYGIATDRVRVGDMPLDLEHWKPAPRADSDKLRLLFVGNDLARKGGAFLLDLFTACLSTFCTLTMVSHDPLLRRIEAPAGVTLYPGLPRSRLVEIFQQSDVFVLPTYREPLGHVLTEAAACGIPAVARDVGGVHCRVSDGVTGRLIPAGAGAAAWEEALRELWKRPERRLEMGRQARAMAEQLFAPTRFAESVAWMLEKLRLHSRSAENATPAPPTEALVPPDR
jgi:hypothetical protein